MARKAKVYKIIETKDSTYGSGVRKYEQVGTLPELVKAYRYTLETGKAYEWEKGNKKINTNPKSIKALVNALYNAKNNAAGNGYIGSYFEYEEVTA